MVQEAEKHAAEDKTRMERVDAKNKLESYLYNTRNAVQEDKVKETLGADTVQDIEAWVKEGIDWLDANPNAEKEEFDDKYKTYEDKIRPIMMKLYQDAGAPGAGADDAPPSSGRGGPTVDEVD
jgi:molecular chaperone DnaK (HSP70)